MLKPIKTKKDYDKALGRAYELIQKDLKPDSRLSDELEILSLLIEGYEEKHYPIPPPRPIEAIKFKLDQMGIDEKELTKILGGRNRKSEILNGRRKLSLSMIRELHNKLKIPAETLIAEY